MSELSPSSWRRRGENPMGIIRKYKNHQLNAFQVRMFKKQKIMPASTSQYAKSNQEDAPVKNLKEKSWPVVAATSIGAQLPLREFSIQPPLPDSNEGALMHSHMSACKSVWLWSYPQNTLQYYKAMKVKLLHKHLFLSLSTVYDKVAHHIIYDSLQIRHMPVQRCLIHQNASNLVSRKLTFHQVAIQQTL